jgi:DNA-binding Lrp family transcriptional regulator
MYRMHATGRSMNEIAEQFGISRQAVAQIIARYGANGITDDESRTLELAQLDYLSSEMIAIVNRGPAPATNVKGELMYDGNGELILDPSGMIAAADTARKISESKRRLMAFDLPRRKQMVEDEAYRQAKAFLAALPQAQVIEDEEN